MQTQIDEIKNKFRILRDWNISVEEDGRYYAQCVANSTERIASIYPYSNDDLPSDYIFHEILHICMSEINNTKKYSEKREKEELFVQDLCKIIYPE